MRLISLKIRGFKNLDFWDIPIDFTQSEGISVFVGNNGSGKSNILEAISAIFKGLYGGDIAEFSYELSYHINDKEILIKQSYNVGGLSIQPDGSAERVHLGPEVKSSFCSYFVDGEPIESINDYLPSQLIALYSGEETRLYEEYYFDEYYGYIEDIVYGARTLQDSIKMNFIDKNFWNIALLTFAVFEDNFNYSNILNIPKVSSAKFSIDEGIVRLFSGKIPSEMYDFLLQIKNDEAINIDELKAINQIGVYRDFFKMLLVTTQMRKDKYRMIDYIEVMLDINGNEFSSEGLSEGQKKQILMYFVTQILADKDSIVLLDEPDSYIHVGNKERIKVFLADFLTAHGEGEFIMTTHSPTLMHKFDSRHLFYLEKGKIIGKDKREILDEITAGQMSILEMEIFLNSNKKYLLVTEGITDKKHLEIAIEKLGIENQFDIYSADGCDKLKQFLLGIPRGFFGDKIVIGIFDYDDAGLKQIKFIGEALEENKKYKVRDRENIFGITLPCPTQDFETHKNCPIEFLYSKEILETNSMIQKRTFDDINRCITNPREKLNQKQIDSKEELFYYKVSESDTSKNNFTDKVRDLDSSEFHSFKVLFDLIISISSS